MTQHGEPMVAHGEDALLREVERLAFEAAVTFSDLSLIVHAGTVSRNGGALILPATSGAGKTTLTYGLALRGWLPLNDDICPMREESRAFVALGCPRCGHLSVGSELRVRGGGIDLEGPVADVSCYFRPVRWGEPAPVRAIITPRYQAGAEVSIAALTQAEGAAALYGSTFRRERVSRHDEWAAALRLGSRVPAFSLTYGSLDSALAGMDTITEALHI